MGDIFVSDLCVHIDHYSFGCISVDGVEYRKDVKLYPSGLEPNWWRAEGHLLQPEDLPELRGRGLDHLVIGLGAQGMMQVSEGAKQLFAELGLAWSAFPTARAVEEYNRRSERGEKVGAVLHLTC